MENLKLHKEGQVYTLQLDRGTANALQTGMIKEITQVFKDLEQDSGCRAVVLTGKGNFFSAGLDVIEIAAYNEAESTEFWLSFAEMMGCMLAFPKPLVAAINGHSPAGGAIMALTCDFRFMAEGKFRIGLNEMSVGIVVPDPIFDMYARVVGEKNAYQFLLEGKLLLPEEALDAGLVDAISPQEEVYTKAMEKAQALAKLEPKTYALTKRNMRKSLLDKFSDKENSYFDATIKHWFDPNARAVLQALVDGLKSK